MFTTSLSQRLTDAKKIMWFPPISYYSQPKVLYTVYSILYTIWCPIENYHSFHKNIKQQTVFNTDIDNMKYFLSRKSKYYWVIPCQLNQMSLPQILYSVNTFSVQKTFYFIVVSNIQPWPSFNTNNAPVLFIVCYPGYPFILALTQQRICTAALTQHRTLFKLLLLLWRGDESQTMSAKVKCQRYARNPVV